jgi:Fe-S cluster assembly protein SufD
MSLIDSLLNPALPEDALSEQRQRARAALRASGLPGARDEAWRYTPLRLLSQRSYAAIDTEAGQRALPAELAAIVQAAPLRLVFVNAEFRQELSTLDRLPSGVEVHIELPAAGETSAAGAAQAFVAANHALARQGISIHVAASALVEAPLQLIQISLTTAVPVALHTRCQLSVGQGASVQLIETHHADAGCAQLSNSLLDVALAAQARLVHTRSCAGAGMSSLHTTRYRLDAGAEVRCFEHSAGQSLSRHQVEVALAGDGARFVSGGVQALTGRAHSDLHIEVAHQARDTACDLVWRGIADQRARLGFTGNLHVNAGADGSDARLSSKNLLLSAHAEINTRPVLVIDADEVKAAHGATVGRLDERALFYLRSRGIGRAQARGMLTHAFAIEALNVLPEGALREAVAQQLQQAMKGFVEAGANER